MADPQSIVGPLSATECEVLAAVASASTASRALEVGHYLGRSTAVLLSSLPEEMELVTIDHHQGDDWCPVTSFDEFQSNVEPFVGDREFMAINEDMATALPSLAGTGKFGFCFYDADHTAEAVAQFWALAEPLLDGRCTLAFDDAEWDEQSSLRALAEEDGFRVVTNRDFVRGAKDKRSPETYTLEIMRRLQRAS